MPRRCLASSCTSPAGPQVSPAFRVFAGVSFDQLLRFEVTGGSLDPTCAPGKAPTPASIPDAAEPRPGLVHSRCTMRQPKEVIPQPPQPLSHWWRHGALLVFELSSPRREIAGRQGDLVPKDPDGGKGSMQIGVQLLRPVHIVATVRNKQIVARHISFSNLGRDSVSQKLHAPSRAGRGLTSGEFRNRSGWVMPVGSMRQCRRAGSRAVSAHSWD